MAYEHKPNTGSLFPPREGAPQGVRFSGEINVDGKLYFITLWDKRDDSQKYWRVTVKPKTAARYTEDNPREPAQGPTDMNDEIPFIPETR